MGNKLELTWYGKDKPINVEPRILIENPTLSNILQDPNTENMLIHGDNLLALKALEAKYAGKIKCIYIDPPYNTGSAFENYDDNLEHSEWLNLMMPRLRLLKSLLSENGVIWIQIDDNEMAYLKVICDEIFGRANYLSTISVKMKNIAGASGGGEDKRPKKNIEYLLIYTKNYSSFKWVNSAYTYTELYNLIEYYKNNDISWKYTSVIYDRGKEEYICSTKDGDGNEIKIFNRIGAKIASISSLAKINGISEKECYYKYIDSIFTTAMPQSSIRPRVIEALKAYNHNDIISIKYTPRSGKNKGVEYEQFYKGNKYRLFTWLKDVVVDIKGSYYKKDLQGTLWDGLNLNNLTKEGNVLFPMGKKPEALIERVINMSTNQGDLVLDSFLGSGTTAAVAHKMNRIWIGVEMGEQAYTHCKIRLDKVIDGIDNGGITEEVNWQGGGGYRFYELAPTLIKIDAFGQAIINPQYNADMLASAIALHEGYKYKPDKEIYWKQSVSNNNSYLYVTTSNVNRDMVDSISQEMKEDETLLIVCKSFVEGCCDDFRNISIKKIPQSILNDCEYDRDNYNLNIVNPPVYEDDGNDGEGTTEKEKQL